MADLKSQETIETVVDTKRSSRECSKCGEKFKLFSTLKRHLIESTECSSDTKKRRKQIEIKGIFYFAENSSKRKVKISHKYEKCIPILIL